MDKVGSTIQGAELALGKQLQEARQHAGLTQQALCQKAGLSYSTLAKIERGAIKSPSIFTIQSIADALGLSMDNLLGHNTASVPTGATPAKKRSKSGISFIYFDINGCLVRFFHRAFTQISADTGASAAMVETTFWHYNDAVCRGEMSLEEFNQALGKQFGAADFKWEEYYLASVDPIKEMHELVRWASEHYDVGLLSNIMPGQIDSMLKQGILPDIPYTAVVDSSEVGAIKPEQHMYEIAQGLAHHEASEILLVDDSRSNLMGAEKMGWKVLWFDDYRPEESAARVRKELDF